MIYLVNTFFSISCLALAIQKNERKNAGNHKLIEILIDNVRSLYPDPMVHSLYGLGNEHRSAQTSSPGALLTSRWPKIFCTTELIQRQKASDSLANREKALQRTTVAQRPDNLSNTSSLMSNLIEYIARIDNKEDGRKKAESTGQHLEKQGILQRNRSALILASDLPGW